jgi:dihydrofolate synthase/folylpolyglutamate synthase
MQDNLIDWLLDYYGQETMRPGLDRIGCALKEILPHFEHTKIITIAGTNGKGETTLRLSRLLKNRKHFVWTSPHIERITERFRDQNGEISIEELQIIIQECHAKVLQNSWELSFYEFLFLVFCTWASRSRPEFLLLEVGLGGRLDAVNVFNAHLVLLPSISRDHQEILGRRYDQILREKLGVLRPEATLIHFLHNEYLIERADKFASSIGAEVKTLKRILNLPDYDFSLRNEALASAAFDFLQGKEFYPENLNRNMTFLEHRGEVLRAENEWIFFGSHNVDGMRKLIQFLTSGTYNFSRPPYDEIIVAFSQRNFQDLSAMMRILKSSKLGKITVTVFDHPKAALGVDIEDLAKKEGLDFVKDIEVHIQDGRKNQRRLVTGSYYFLGHFKSFCSM